MRADWTDRHRSGPSFATLNKCEPDISHSQFPYISPASSVAEKPSYGQYLTYYSVQGHSKPVVMLVTDNSDLLHSNKIGDYCVPANILPSFSSIPLSPFIAYSISLHSPHTSWNGNTKKKLKRDSKPQAACNKSVPAARLY